MADAVEKVAVAGCYVDEATFRKLVARSCPALWSGRFNEPDIHAEGQPINIDEERADSGWTKVGANGMQYTGSPDHVEISGHHVANNTGNHWAHPHIEVQRNGTAIAEGSGLHMDDSGTYSGRTTINISFVDAAPGTDPIYTFISREDDNRTMNNPTIPSLSPLTLKAVIV